MGRMTSHQIVAVDVPRPPAEDGRVERTATAGRTLGAGGSAGTLIKHTCRNCGAPLKHRNASGHPAEWAAVLDCTACAAVHVLRVSLSTMKDVA